MPACRGGTSWFWSRTCLKPGPLEDVALRSKTIAKPDILVELVHACMHSGKHHGFGAKPIRNVDPRRCSLEVQTITKPDILVELAYAPMGGNIMVLEPNLLET